MKSNTEYKGFKTESTYDPFGNLIVWLPFGIAGNVLHDTEGSYTLSRSSLESAENNISLAGIPVTWWHDDEMLTPEFQSASSLGVCTGVWREKTPGVFEAQAKISSPQMIKAIEAKHSFETSPGYLTWNEGEDRYFNHIAIIPPGYAKGGREMTLKTESEKRDHRSDTLVHKTLNTNNNLMTTETPIDSLAIAEAVITAMKTESETLKDLISTARTEGYESGLLQGSKEAGLRIRAESIELEIEDDCEFGVMVNALISQYLPMLTTTGMTESQTYALAEAAMCVAESKKKPGEVAEVKIETPKSLTIESNVTKTEATTPVVKKLSNFLL